MLFSFGKNASTSVFKTANHLKDVIEKKVIDISYQSKLVTVILMKAYIYYFQDNYWRFHKRK